MSSSLRYVTRIATRSNACVQKRIPGVALARVTGTACVIGSSVAHFWLTVAQDPAETGVKTSLVKGETSGWLAHVHVHV